VQLVPERVHALAVALVANLPRPQVSATLSRPHHRASQGLACAPLRSTWTASLGKHTDAHWHTIARRDRCWPSTLLTIAIRQARSCSRAACAVASCTARAFTHQLHAIQLWLNERLRRMQSQKATPVPVATRCSLDITAAATPRLRCLLFKTWKTRVPPKPSALPSTHDDFADVWNDYAQHTSLPP
jgi:hypothetical protein